MLVGVNRESSSMTATVLVCGNIFDGSSEGLSGPAEVLVEGNRITRVARPVNRPNGAQVIDLSPARAGQGSVVGLCLEYRRFTLGCGCRSGRARDTASDGGPHPSGFVSRLHNARQPGARESLLGWSCPPASCQSMVHGILGRVWFCGAIWRRYGGKRWVAIHLFRVRSPVADRVFDGSRHSRE